MAPADGSGVLQSRLSYFGPIAPLIKEGWGPRGARSLLVARPSQRESWVDKRPAAVRHTLVTEGDDEDARGSGTTSTVSTIVC